MAKNFPKDRTKALYVRLYLDKILPDKYKKILYLDTDIRIARDGLYEIFNTEMGTYPVGAISGAAELMHPSNEMWIDYKLRLGHSKSDSFFNAGVLLINRELYTSSDISKHTIDFICHTPYKDCLDDQSALNAALRNNWLELSPIYNWSITTRSWLLREFNPILVHYIGRSKPWRDYRFKVPEEWKAQMKEFYIQNGFGENFKNYSRYYYLLRTAESHYRHFLDLIGLDRRSRSIRNFMRRWV